MNGVLMTCIVLKSNVTVMDVVSTKMLGTFGFLVRCDSSSPLPGASCTMSSSPGANMQHGSAICVMASKCPPHGLRVSSRKGRLPAPIGNAYPLQAQVFGIFQRNEVSVDVVATSEVSISLTLDPSKIWGRDLISEELEALKVRCDDPHLRLRLCHLQAAHEQCTSFASTCSFLMPH